MVSLTEFRRGQMRDKAQSQREKAIELEAIVRQLTEQNGKLVADLEEKADTCSDLSMALEKQRAHGASIQCGFEVYKEEHMISGDLGAL